MKKVATEFWQLSCASVHDLYEKGDSENEHQNEHFARILL
jgi:hypothetical protein